jgi:hypothetical protein
MVTVRRATKEDIESFSSARGKPSIKAWCGVNDDGVIIGLGGLAYKEGRWFAFCDLTPEARKYKITIAKMGRQVMRDAVAGKHKFVYAGVDTSEPMAARWVESLGFRRQEHSGLYLWRG